MPDPITDDADRTGRRVSRRSVPQLGREVAGLGLLVVVSVAAVLFARLFKESTLGVIEWVSGTSDPTEAARDGNWWVVAMVVAVAVVVAAVLGAIARRRAGERIGLTAVAAAARGEGTGPSVRGTLLEGGATWVASTGLASLGRELAIVEAGGALGAASGRQAAEVRSVARGRRDRGCVRVGISRTDRGGDLCGRAPGRPPQPPLVGLHRDRRSTEPCDHGVGVRRACDLPGCSGFDRRDVRRSRRWGSCRLLLAVASSWSSAIWAPSHIRARHAGAGR